MDSPDEYVIETQYNKMHIKKRDPYGHWFLNLDKGQLPPHLKGAYTSVSKARQAALNYLNEKGKVVVSNA